MSTPLDELLVDPEFYQNPYPVYQRLQEEAPVHWCEPWKQWVVTRHDDVMNVLRSPGTYSSSGWEARFMSLLPPEQRLEHLKLHYSTSVLSNTDPPGHTRLRRIVSKSFAPRMLEGLRPVIEELVTDQFTAIPTESSVDLLSALAYPLPARVIGKMLGSPDESRDRFEVWSKDIIEFLGTGSPDLDRAHRANRSIGQFNELLSPLIEERRACPNDDLLGLLVAAELDGEALTDQELLSTAVTLLFAGHETTANLIANAVLCLLRYPDQLDRLRIEPALLAAAVEEVLRFEGPVQRVRRMATMDVEIGDQTIRAGQPVMAFLGAANRDSTKFDRPHEFDISRTGPGNLAFGHGIHFCVGAGLSRLEAPIVLGELLGRFDRWQFAPGNPPQFRENITFRGLERLDLVLSN